MFKDIPNFFPTPPHLVKRMAQLLQGQPRTILEPSAGKGDLIEGLKAYAKEFDDERHRHYYRPFEHAEFSAIEIDPTLQATLRGKGIRLIDSDFLAFAGPDKFEATVLNPPFDQGDLHLLKAIQILYRGEIVCLLNAETIRNPCTNTRKLLCRKLDELGAHIEYHQGAFAQAERPTDVEVALVYIKIDRKVEEDIFADATDRAAECTETVRENFEISTGKTLEELVADYNQILKVGTEVILTYYRHFNKIGAYLGLNDAAEHSRGGTRSGKDLTEKLQAEINALAKNVRKDFWRRTLEMPEVQKRLTASKRAEFEHALTQHANMDFTESNIRQFVLNLIGNYEQTLIAAVIEIFDLMTERHSWRGGEYEKNILWFDGWKTNKAWKVNRKVILPGGRHDESFWCSWQKGGTWKLDYSVRPMLEDIEVVMNYFDGMSPGAVRLAEAIERSLLGQVNKDILSTYFVANCFKKGTVHLFFRDEDILRRFNVVACRGKGWLPDDYGHRPYGDMSAEERAVVDSFEGETSYTANLGATLLPVRDVPRIAA